MTHLNLRVDNDTWTSLGDEFEVPLDHFWGEKCLQNDFSRAFSETGLVWSNDYCFSPSVNRLSKAHANIHFSQSVTIVIQIILFSNFVLCVNQLL